jgi:16S rRNA processing protein RimM
MVGTSPAGWVIIGRLHRTRGIRGELTAELYSTHPDRAGRLNRVRIEKGAASLIARVEHAWYHNGRLVLKLLGVDSISAAEAWEGADMLVEEADREPLAEGEYSHADLIGCTLLREEGEDAIGVVRGIEEYGGPPLLTLETPEGREILIPFARSICREIDVERKRIRAWLPEGLA